MSCERVGNTAGFTKKNRHKISYLNLVSAIRPVPHSDEVLVPVFEQLPSLEDADVIMEDVPDSDSDPDYAAVPSAEPKRFN